jgi:hypothetical protein
MPVRHKAPTVSKARFDELLEKGKRVAQKAREKSAKHVAAGVGLTAAIGSGVTERYVGLDKMRVATGGVEPNLVAGVLTGLLLPMALPSTKSKEIAATTGLCLAAVGSNKVASGVPVFVNVYGT